MLTQNEIFLKLWKESEEKIKKDQRLNNVKINCKNDDYYLIPVLKKNGFDTWDKLDKESVLIVEHKSQLSSKVRKVVDHFHTAVLIFYSKQYENG